MSTRTEERRYLSDLTIALQLRDIPGDRIGEIVAEVEVHTAESGQRAADAFGPAKDYARQFEPADSRTRRPGWQTWAGALAAAIGAFLLVDGAFAGMANEDVFGIPGWWACGIGVVVLLVTSSLMPLNVVVDPRRPRARRRGRAWLLGWVAGGMVVVIALVVGVMSLVG